jgi:type II secretory pathway pseudopilin PulG
MRARKERRGFALLIIVLLIGILSVTAASMLDVVSTDQFIIGQQNRQARAESVAETAIVEIASSSDLGRELVKATPTLALPNPGSAGSLLVKSASDGDGKYDATITFLRERGVHETTQNILKAAIYDVDVTARTSGAEAEAMRRIQIGKPFKVASGRIRPDVVVTR